MNLTLKRFQIFQSGTHRNSKGITRTYPDSLLESVVNEYNSREIRNAPLYIDHPPEYARRSHEAMGLVNKLEFSNGKIYAHAYIGDSLLSKVRRGALRAVSAGFTQLGAAAGMVLDHVAFLNNPAVKNMEALNFSDGLSGSAVELNFSEPKSDHERVTHYATRHGISYEKAAHIVLGSGRPIESGVCFAEDHKKAQAIQFLRALVETHSSGNESQKLHRLAIQYQQEHGVSYEQAVRACLHKTNY